MADVRTSISLLAFSILDESLMSRNLLNQSSTEAILTKVVRRKMSRRWLTLRPPQAGRWGAVYRRQRPSRYPADASRISNRVDLGDLARRDREAHQGGRLALDADDHVGCSTATRPSKSRWRAGERADHLPSSSGTQPGCRH